MNTFVVLAICGFASGALGALGVGGGGVLIVALSTFFSFEQDFCAQINLMFFLPIALVSTFIYIKRGLCDVKSVGKMAITGCIGAVLGVILAPFITAKWVSKLFGALLIFSSVQLLLKKEN